MTYFKNCKNIEQVKREYRRLAKELHPDNGGNAAEFQKMQADFEKAFDRFKNVHETKDGETYTKQESSRETARDFAGIIDKLIFMQGVKIEIIGSWVWVTGNTYEYRETLKGLHFNWSGTKKAWYNTGETTYTKRRGRYSMKQLRNRFGSVEVETESRTLLK